MFTVDDKLSSLCLPMQTLGLFLEGWRSSRSTSVRRVTEGERAFICRDERVEVAVRAHSLQKLELAVAVPSPACSMWTGNVSRAEWALFFLATPVMLYSAGMFHRQSLVRGGGRGAVFLCGSTSFALGV